MTVWIDITDNDEHYYLQSSFMHDYHIFCAHAYYHLGEKKNYGVIIMEEDIGVRGGGGMVRGGGCNPL